MNGDSRKGLREKWEYDKLFRKVSDKLKIMFLDRYGIGGKIMAANPNPLVHYCRAKTISRLPRFFLGMVILVAGLVCFVVGFCGESKDFFDYLILFTGAIVLLAGGMTAFKNLRDVLFPSKSTLAKSIRVQLSASEKNLSGKELFSLVDRDISQYGKWFGCIAVGKEWVLGDEVTRLNRIRGIFDKDEWIEITGKRKVHRIQLILVTDQHKVQINEQRSSEELKKIKEYLLSIIPEAFSGVNTDYISFLAKTEEEFAEFERNFEQKKAERVQREKVEREHQVPWDIILENTQGQTISAVTREMVLEQIEQLKKEGEIFSIFPSYPISIREKGLFQKLTSAFVQGKYRISACFRLPDGSYGDYVQIVEKPQLTQIMTDFLNGELPVYMTDWELFKSENSVYKKSESHHCSN